MLKTLVERSAKTVEHYSVLLKV